MNYTSLKGPFTNYVSHIWGGLDPPPLSVSVSNWPTPPPPFVSDVSIWLTPLPPFVSDVSIWLTPLPPFVSDVSIWITPLCQQNHHLASPPFVYL